MVNVFLKYGGSEVRNKLLSTINIISGKGEVPSDFRKTLVKPLYERGDKTECGYYRGIGLVSLGFELLSNMALFRLRHAVNKVIREEQYGFRKVEDALTEFLLVR